MAGGRFDADAGGDARDDDLRDAEPLEVRLEIRAGERTPGSLGHQMVLPVAGSMRGRARSNPAGKRSARGGSVPRGPARRRSR